MKKKPPASDFITSFLLLLMLFIAVAEWSWATRHRHGRRTRLISRVITQVLR